ncbi:ferritin [Aminivibrio sp.]|jgi:ferritin|uniref:ferritin n=1 Tax=Aminivibrio sp. TaxID=1872489 RepID=UPI001A5CE109|nr:ferritin [Aminivibrio sp.]MBL3538428.1 ferritin [Aminivibrio sp.]MDK2958347.1 ferritin [Synergistaceae bacterium]
MISKKIEDAFNDQINAELYSAYIYLSMSAYLNSVDLNGMAHWMKVQAKEELEHATKFASYIVARGGRVKYKAIECPREEWASALEVFKGAYEHERYVTRRINDLMDLAVTEKDYAAQVFLQWFVSEQVEEEANTDGIVKKMEMIGEGRHGMYMIDKELGERKAD